MVPTRQRPHRYWRTSILLPSTKTSILVRKKQSSASAGLQTMGPFSLKELLKRAARRVRRELSTISAARSLNRHGIDIIGLAMHADLRAANSCKQCPVCGFEGPFKPFGNPPRWDALCPGCGCLERHRFLSILLNQGLLTEGREILHFAPEKHVGRLLRNYAKRYVTADLYQPQVDMKLNIEETGLPDGSFDVIVCSHVLQYVDDKKALLELRRILRPDGLLILMVPVVDGISTYEDLPLNPDERESSFWDRDWRRRPHDPGAWLRGLRVYGSDFRDLLRSSGFEFKEHIAEGRTAINCALQMGDKIFVCWH